MGKPPDGLQPHILWDMDGRQWIENTSPAFMKTPAFHRALERGWVVVIPQELVAELVAKVKA